MSILDLFRLEGRTALITGASSGLGVHFARALGEAGAVVVLSGRRVERLEENVAALRADGIVAHAVACDVADPASCREAVGRVVELCGGLDVLVNNAGVASAIPASKETPEQFSAVLATNLEGAYWMAQSAAACMKPGGSIINVSSILGLRTAGLPQAAYAASKSGLLGLTRDLAAQWTGRRGIRVNAVAPGFFASEMTDEYADGYLDQQLSRLPAGRLGEPEELAAAVLWLASPAGGYVTGQTIVVDGGFLIS